jgi:cation:H+ antiporter
MEYLIPKEWFVDLHWSLLVLIGGVAMAALIKGADWLVEGASGIALRLGISKVIVGATVVSLGTTSPECAVSVMAAWGGNAGLALGNAVGSIIADTGLIFGVGCLLMPLPVDRFILNRQGWVQFGSATLLAIICYALWWGQGDAAAIPRVVGLGMLGILGWYLWISVRWGRQHSRMTAPAHADEAEHLIENALHDSRSKLAGLFLVGLLLVIVFGHILISSVESAAHQFGIPQVVIASTIVAFGTSLPELVVGITAIRKGHAALLIGNVIGADVLNVLFVIGASAAAAKLPVVDPSAAVPRIFLYLHLPTMLVILTLFRGYIFNAVRRGHFQRWFGVPMVSLYVLYILMNLLLSR